MVKEVIVWRLTWQRIAQPMAIIIDGNSEIGAHARSNLCYLNCLRHLIRLRAIKNLIFFLQERPIFLDTCATCSELPSNISTIAPPDTGAMEESQRQVQDSDTFSHISRFFKLDISRILTFFYDFVLILIFIVVVYRWTILANEHGDLK